MTRWGPVPALLTQSCTEHGYLDQTQDPPGGKPTFTGGMSYPAVAGL